VFRIVLDVVDTALIIGRGGNTVRQIEQTTGGRVKRLQEPPGAREQVVVVWNNQRELPTPGRVGRNTAQVSTGRGAEPRGGASSGARSWCGCSA
jgi:hypothetical protein